MVSTLTVFAALCAVAEAADVAIDGDMALSQTDESFICVAMDWWPEDKCDYGWCPWGNASILNVDLNHPGLRAGLKALSAERPVHLRIGGSLADIITYNVTGKEECFEYKKENTSTLGYDLKGTCLPMDRWHAIHDLCEDTGCDLMFGVNALKGREFHGCAEDPEYGPETDCHSQGRPACCTNFTTPWDSTNARDFLQYTAKQLSKYRAPFALEFGNEVAGPHGIQAKLTVEDYARDFKVFSKLVREAWPTKTPKLVATDTGYDEEFTTEFLAAVDGDLDIFTHHMYFLGPGVDPNLQSKILSPSYLDQLKPTASEIQSNLNKNAPKAQIWMGETGGAYNSGHHLVTDAFISGFWYIDNMATLAHYGHQGFCRQTLVGGNYGLLNTTTMRPNPDFYTALLWQRLMGQTVLNASVSGPSTLRAYAHCARGRADAVTVVAMNMGNESITVDSLAKYGREEYHLSAKSLNSQEMLLNGAPLRPGADASIPKLEPKVVHAGEDFTMEAMTYAFVVLSDVSAPACSADVLEMQI